MKILFVFILSVLLYFESISQQNDQSIIDIAITKSKLYSLNNKNFVTIIDFNKSINEERLYLVDIRKRNIVLKIIFNFSNLIKIKKHRFYLCLKIN